MKKIDFKSTIIGLVSGILLVSGISVASTLVTGDVYFSSFPIYVNGSYYTSSSPLLNYNGRTYVPLNEIGTMLGTNVVFNNNTIYLTNNNNNSYNDNYYDNYYNKTQMREEEIDLEVNESEEYYVSLARFGAKNAKITTTGSSYVKLSATQLLSSGDLRITGKKEGNATVKITYSTGDVEILYVNVYEGDDDEKDIEMEVGDTHKIYIDLDDYDADSAKVTYDSDYIKVSKTSFTNDGYLTITAKDEGETTVKIKYDSGDTVYYYIEIEDEDYYDNEDDIEMEVGDTCKIYIDLDDYDADSAKVTYDSDYVKVSKTSFTNNGYLTITAKDEGDTTVKIKYDSGDTEYYYIEIEDDDYNNNYDEIEIEEDEYEYLYIDLEEFNATSAELTYNSSYIKLSKTQLTESGKVKVTGKNEGYTSIKIKFNTGDVVYVDVEVTD